MKAMLFCAGVGSRLSPITDLVPKPMIDFFGRPLVDYILPQLLRWGVDEIVVNLHHRAEVLRRDLETRWGNVFRLHFSNEPHLLGTGGGLKKVERLFGGRTFLIANSDFLLDPSVDIGQMLDLHSRNGAAATLLLKKDSTGRYTPIQLDDNGRISMLGSMFGTHDPNRPLHAFCGLQILEPVVLQFLPPNEPSSVISANVNMLGAGLAVQGFILDAYWRELGDLDSYRQAHFDVLDGTSPYRRVVEEGGRFAVIQDRHGSFELGDFEIALDPEVRIEPPVALGRSCIIGKGAAVGPYAVIGENARIGKQAEITRSVVWRGATIGPNKKLRDSVVYQ